MLLDDSQGRNQIKIGRHKLIFGWFRMDKGFTHMQFGSVLYKGVATWEYGVYLGVIAMYIRWELPL